MRANSVAIAITVVSFACGAAAMRYADSREVASILQSDDMDITRNVEQANALLDVYEQALTEEQRQKAVESIPNGVEIVNQ